MLNYPNPFKVRQYDNRDVPDASRNYPTTMGRLKRYSNFFIAAAFAVSAVYTAIDAGYRLIKGNNSDGSNNNVKSNKNGKF